jgi:alkylation response protein AidB-like acyl-CoA dehydrogenase
VVNFGLSEEQQGLREALRRFLGDRSTSAEVRRLMDSEVGYDRDVWHLMADQLGLAGLAIPEEYGGSGYGFVELAIVFEETGATLLCSPLLSTVALAANALLLSDDTEAKMRYLPKLAAGELTATLAFTEDDGQWDPAKSAMTAVPCDGGWLLTGTKSFVVDGHTAELILVAARTDAGLSLFSVPGNAPGLTRTALPTMDQTRKQARLTFADTPAELIGTAGGAEAVLARTLDLAVVALAAEATGGAQRCLDMSVAYAKDRIQFGRPIGSFQAIKHMCADMLVQVESARSASSYAGHTAAEENQDLPIAASTAKAFCTEAFFHAAAQNIQIHGGIGFTWEHDAHLYFKRAKSSELMFGDPDFHRERVAQQLGI